MFCQAFFQHLKHLFHVHCPFSFENRAVYDIMWKNIVQPDRPQMTIQRMRVACYTTKATKTQPDYGIFIGFPLQQWLSECMFCYMYIVCPLFYFKKSCFGIKFLYT